MLHPLTAFAAGDFCASDQRGTDYWYEGRCPYTGQVLRLPRTAAVRAIARSLMTQLAQTGVANPEGKMYGVLLVQTPVGKLAVLKAFSGLLDGHSQVEGWVPSIPGREQVALAEAKTLAALDRIKQQLGALQQLPERQRWAVLSQAFEQRLTRLNQQQQQRKQARQLQRELLQTRLAGAALAAALESLDEQSRRDGLEKRRLKRERDQVLGPLGAAIATADDQMLALKRQRKALSRQLQAQMHETYRLTNFVGHSQPLEALAPGRGLPTGTGACCAPKLLQYAATHTLTPLAMAEFWWGRPTAAGDRLPGQFYAACEERCQPIMGFLLAGLGHRPALELALNPSWLSIDVQRAQAVTARAPLSAPPTSACTVFPAAPLKLLYEDPWLIAIDKPSGLLSVPGRYLHTQDSVWSRLSPCLPDGIKLLPVHRLDQDTSGILLVAYDRETHRQLSHQFAQHQVQKVYEAVLEGTPASSAGVIDLPLGRDPGNRPCQKVDWHHGKPSLTRFQVLSSTPHQTRIELVPVTGRTHQLRVHAAAAEGLGVPILGDRLYSPRPQSSFLHLHARELCFQHPHSGQWVHLKAEMPF